MTDNDLRRFRGRIKRCFQPYGVQVGVSLGGGDVVMPKCLLYQPDISGSVVQNRGKRVSDGMGCDTVIYPGLSDPRSHKTLDLTFREPRTSCGGPDGFMRWCALNLAPYNGDEASTNDNPVRLTTLGTAQGHGPGCEVDVPDVQSGRLAESTPGQQHERQQGAVTISVPSAELVAEDLLNLGFGQHHRRQSSVSAALEDRRRVARDQPPRFTPAEQGLQRDPVAVDGRLGALRSTGANLDAVSGHEPQQQLRRDGLDVGGTDEPAEHGEVPPVRGHGVRRATLLLKVIEKLFHGLVGSHGGSLLCGWFAVVLMRAPGVGVIKAYLT